jgi:hypothetical protein
MRNKLTLMIGSTTLVLASTVLTVAVQFDQPHNRNPRQDYLSAAATMQQRFKKHFGDCLHRIESTAR